jgi:cell division protein FtsB
MESKPKYIEYKLKSFFFGIVRLTTINIILALGLVKWFGLVPILGMFFLVEHFFICHLIIDANQKNIKYLKHEVEKLEGEVKKLKKHKHTE